MSFTLIAATTPLGVLGDTKNPGMLWNCPDELRHFKTQTLNKTCYVGFNTAKTLPPLPGREVIVLLTREDTHPSELMGFLNKGFKYLFLKHPTDLLRTLQIKGAFESADEHMIIGGAKLYELFMPLAAKLIISTVFDTKAKGDIYFPPVRGYWELTDAHANLPGGFIANHYVPPARKAIPFTESTIPQFITWLDNQGIKHREGKGEYQVLQVKLPTGWEIIFRKKREAELTCTLAIRSYIETFLKGLPSLKTETEELPWDD